MAALETGADRAEAPPLERTGAGMGPCEDRCAPNDADRATAPCQMRAMGTG